MIKKILLSISGALAILAICAFTFYLIVKPDYPIITANEDVSIDEPLVGSDSFRKLGNNWLKLNEHGLWEMYLEGAPYERGLIYGKLAKRLVQDQEKYFVQRIKEMIPSEMMLSFLKYFIAWFNRDIDQHITDEYQKEIYGISQAFSNDYDFIAPKYYRILNYHAAHDIGHALQDLMLVGCTSFASWNEYSSDSTLVIGRNFDFYVGDDFAKNKLITFIKPQEGYPFASVSWGGMIGVVSGMNIQGLTVTINAAKSEIPTGSKTPISLLAREILQYASNIEEAIDIASSKDVFVSESLLIGSDQDNKAVIIEKGPGKMGVFDPNTSQLVCANHYQSSAFMSDEANVDNIENSDSNNRFKRMNELLDDYYPINVKESVAILRDQNGVDNLDIGLANPSAINQLLAHHGIVFKPSQKQVWISAYPFQLGEFVCYDLDSVFSKATAITSNEDITEKQFLVEKDSFLLSSEYLDFQQFHKIRKQINKATMANAQINISTQELEGFKRSNPNSYLTYKVIGDYHKLMANFDSAIYYYDQSLNYTVASKYERTSIEQMIEECKRRK